MNLNKQLQRFLGKVLKMRPGFLLPMVKCKRTEIHWELLHKKEPASDNHWEFFTSPISKDAKIKRFTARKAWSKKKAEGVTLQPFAETWESYPKIRVFIHKRLRMFLTDLFTQTRGLPNSCRALSFSHLSKSHKDFVERSGDMTFVWLSELLWNQWKPS